MYYDREGKPISMREWCALLEDAKYKILRRTDLPDGSWVSTVWLGLDHRFEEGAPLIFETMVFPKGSWAELDCNRYNTEESALAGHEAMVEKWRKKA